MAEACSLASLGQLAWKSDWHIREETYVLALRCLVDQQRCEPFAAHFGSGTSSSSDGQFFQAAGFSRDAARLNAHHSQRSGFKIYSHLSDRYARFYTKLIAATASEALRVRDALLYHQSEIATRRHHTDGGGDSDHVFALCSLLGFKFAPRIPDLKHRRLYSFGKPSAYPALEPMIAGRINVALIRAHWSDILRVVASIRTGTVTASLIMRQLAAYPRQNGVATALRELGRLERTLFTLDWISEPELRRETGQELNKGEARNSLAPRAENRPSLLEDLFRLLAPAALAGLDVIRLIEPVFRRFGAYPAVLDGHGRLAAIGSGELSFEALPVRPQATLWPHRPRIREETSCPRAGSGGWRAASTRRPSGSRSTRLERSWRTSTEKSTTQPSSGSPSCPVTRLNSSCAAPCVPMSSLTYSTSGIGCSAYCSGMETSCSTSDAAGAPSR